MSISDEIEYRLDLHYPRTPRFQLPRYQGPIWATMSAALGFKSMLILEDPREIGEMIDAVRAIADEYRGRVRYCVSDTRVDFPRGGELLIRSLRGRTITRHFDQIFTLMPGPAETAR